MSFRFRRRIKLLPGVHLNVGKKSLSVSAGKPGAQVTIGKESGTATVGIPGTGLSYTKTAHRTGARAQPAPPEREPTQESNGTVNLAIGIGAFVCLGLLAKGCSML